MERRGIRTEKGDTNRQIAADNKLLKELRARLSRLYAWSAEEDHGVDSQKDIRLEVINRVLSRSPNDSEYQKTIRLKTGWAIFNFMQEHQIQSLADLHQYIKDKNSEYYSTRREIVSIEKQIALLNDRLAMWEQYETNKPVRQKLSEIKPNKREKYKENHRAELLLFESSSNYFDELTASGEKITSKAWKKELDKLSAEKERLYRKMNALKEEVKTMETFKKTVDELAKEQTAEQDYSRTVPENGILR